MKSYPLFGHEKKIIRDNSHSICNVYILLFMLILPVKEFFDVPGLSRAFIGAALVVLQWVEKREVTNCHAFMVKVQFACYTTNSF